MKTSYTIMFAIGIFLLVSSAVGGVFISIIDFDEDGKCYDRFSNEIVGEICKVSHYRDYISLCVVTAFLGFLFMAYAVMISVLDEFREGFW